VALRDDHPAIGLSDPWTQPARIAIEAAYPLLLHAARDRVHSLEVQVAKVRQLLDESPIGPTRNQACLTLFNIRQVIAALDQEAQREVDR